MNQTTTRKPSLNLPGRAQRKPFDLPLEELVRAGYLTSGEQLPLVLRPAVAELDLAEWARNNLAFIETELSRHGAILFRGFQLDSASGFEQFALAICPELFNENGEHPRETISGKVYTPVFYPPDKQLLWHNENSYNHRWPTKIWFCCLTPAHQGGETPLVDSRRVFNLIDTQLRRKFEEKQIMYVRNYKSGLGLDWQTVFQTSDKAEVERRCREALMEFEWKAGDLLRTRCVRPAVIRHPRTGENSWFNQAQHWHISCLEAKVREVLTSSFTEEDLPRHCYYGDGSPIEDSVMDEILGVYRELEVSFPWQAGDIVMLDNLLTAHGRNPYVGERKLLVAMGDMMSYGEV
ncbi:MAG: TauD/TfdA family dioxygenase [Pyrinomonadaceae bacterium]